MKALTIQYSQPGENETPVPCVFVRTWHRGQVPEVKMSTSSGPKDYTCNKIFAAFEVPGTKYVSMYVSRGVPFLLWTAEDGRVRDASGREVTVVH